MNVGGEVMKAEEEVMKTLEMLQNAGFQPVDAIFKGMLAVMKRSTLEMLQKLADEGEALGTITVVYKTPNGGLRSIEIPIGEEQDQEEQPQQTPQQ